MRYEARNINGKWVVWDTSLDLAYTNGGVVSFLYEGSAQAGASYLNEIHPS